MKTSFYSFILIIPIFLSACSSASPSTIPTQTLMSAMDMEEMPDETGKYAPLVGGLYNGGEIQFIHTEASDPDVANMLTNMMGGPKVVLVPELVSAPNTLLANVYVFTNGVEGMGPFGFQPDIFDSVPGEAGYRPLRRVHLVAWNEGTTPRTLRSVTELQATEAGGEVTITRPGIVVNMPILVWPGGHR